MPPRRITVSTAGVVPGIEALAAADLGVNLALSLNATTQEDRQTIMPHGDRWPLKDVLEAMGRFPLGSRRRLTLEYVMLEGVNDTPGDARRLVKIARRLPCKINLIPFNEASVLPFTRPTPESIEHFKGILLNEKVPTSVRYSKGRDIGAACGQLAAARSAA
jgi:23S rRNA (adenine2503-C2)-methyltransferase